MDETVEHNYLYKKIDAIEHRVEVHISKIEQRLDQLVNILGSVSSLHDRENRNTESIVEIKANIKEALEKGEKAITKLHDRIDDINKSIEDDTICFNNTTSGIDRHVTEVNDEVVKWRERGIGLWVGVTALIFCIQIMGGYILKSFDEAYKVTKTQVLDMSRRQMEVEQELTKLNNALLNKPH